MYRFYKIAGLLICVLGVLLTFQAFRPLQTQDAINSIQVDTLNAAGDGTTNDRAAVMNAFNKLLLQADTGPATLVFGVNKSYYLKRSANLGTNAAIIFKIDGKQNDITIDGQGSTLILDLYDSAFLLTNNKKNITIKNLKIAYISTNFTQGKITKIILPNPKIPSPYFEMAVDTGYPRPDPATASYSNSGVFNEQKTFLRDPEVFVEKTKERPTNSIYCTAGNLLVYPTLDTRDDLNKIQVGNKIAFGIIKKNGRVFEMAHNAGKVSLTNIEIYGSMGGSILADENDGEMIFDSIQIKPKPNSENLIATLADGLHIFANRGRVTIKNCYIEKILDDGINIGSMAELATAIDVLKNTIDLRSTALGGTSPELRAGDTISAYNIDESDTKIKKYFLGSAKILSAPSGYQRIRQIKLDKMIPNIVLSDAGDNDGGQNFESHVPTRFFINEISNPNFVVINNKIMNKQRNGVLARGPRGLVRGNTIQNVGGSAVYATNTLKFNEGPAPVNIEISGNSINGVGDNGVVIGFNSYTVINGQTVKSNAEIANNVFNNLDTVSIKAINTSDVNISGNLLPNGDQTSYVNNANITGFPFYSLFGIENQNGIYFSSELGYCKYKSMEQVISIWGDGYKNYLSVLEYAPNARKFKGDCGPNEGIFKVEPNRILRGSQTGTACQFGSMENLIRQSGIENGDQLKRFPAVPAGMTDSKLSCAF